MMRCPLSYLGLFLVAVLAGCMVGPHYQQPPVAVPAQWKEGPVQDGVNPGQWWDLFGDATLNRLEEQAVTANQELHRAVARVTEARALARVSTAELYPTVTFDPSVMRSRLSKHRPNPNPTSPRSFTSTDFLAPVDMSYEVDLWGRVRRSLEAAEAEASAADLQVVLLTLTADVAQTYFALRSVDSQRALLDRTVELRKEALRLVQARFDRGIASELEVSQAETELATTEADAISLAQQRATLEHALAVLVGAAAEDFGLVENPLDLVPPVIPAGLPSQLLERRPDVVEAERLIAAANARIGVAQAAFFPTIVLTSAAGFESADIGKLFLWPSAIWAAGPHISFPVFEGGRLTANLQAAQAQYEQAVATYRQQILVAFQEVEDALARLRVLAEQAQAQARAVAAARQTAVLANIQYREGLASYINVVDAERAALDTERAAIQILGQRVNASVRLVKAFGGGWHTGAASVSGKSVP